MRVCDTVSTIIWCLNLGQLPAAEVTTRPNIVLMMADDMGMGDTSAYQDFTGNSDADQIHTPNMERLASSGVRFTDAHTPSSRCSPTRYRLLTGRYPWRNRLKFWVLFGVQGDPMIERDRPTLATLMKGHQFNTNDRGLGVNGGKFGQVDDGQTILVQFDKDVIVESVAVVAGNGVCGGHYQIGEKSPLAIYCVDADIDSKDQSGVLSDLGVIRVGESLSLSSSPHYGVEAAGRWRIGAINFRVLP